ncbi:hypothetical protein IQ244_20855 [Nostoc sp. LEGE 06077]|uniref:hypothetical protein n=1 Tax=Nostoc sp. LEGE 06077 TaxID=915325 RepID=UPI00187EC638|nr:hypothetical protein [Nostoc sp. LEGE 06077]MBE9208943.1 hypothetical protein [Nostoc sp. LEGE 06077]
MVNQPQRPLILDGNTYASNPGNLKVDYLYWMRSFPSRPIQLILPIVQYGSVKVVSLSISEEPRLGGESPKPPNG